MEAFEALKANISSINQSNLEQFTRRVQDYMEIVQQQFVSFSSLSPEALSELQSQAKDVFELADELLGGVDQKFQAWEEEFVELQHKCQRK